MKKKFISIWNIITCDRFFVHTEKVKTDGELNSCEMETTMTPEGLEAMSGLIYNFYHNYNHMPDRANEILNQTK